MRTSPHSSAPLLPIDRIARVLYPAAVAVIVSATLWVSSLFDEPPRLTIGAALGFIAWVALLSEAIRHYSRWLERSWPWHARAAGRLVLQVGGSTLAIIAFGLAAAIGEVEDKLDRALGTPGELRQGRHVAVPHGTGRHRGQQLRHVIGGVLQVFFQGRTQLLLLFLQAG